MPEKAMSLEEAAASLGWSRRTLKSLLIKHGIPTIGTGRRARLEAKDLELLKNKEREVAKASAPYSHAESIEEARRGATASVDARMRSYWRRRLGQLNRRPKNA